MRLGPHLSLHAARLGGCWCSTRDRWGSGAEGTQTGSQARQDLAHVSAVIAIFESGGDERTAAFYFDTHRLLKKGEMVTLVRAELAKGEPLDTRELSRRIAVAKGLDGGDKVLLRAISYRLVRALLIQLRRGTIASPGKVRGVRVWEAVA